MTQRCKKKHYFYMYWCFKPLTWPIVNSKAQLLCWKFLSFCQIFESTHQLQKDHVSSFSKTRRPFKFWRPELIKTREKTTKPFGQIFQIINTTWIDDSWHQKLCKCMTCQTSAFQFIGTSKWDTRSRIHFDSCIDKFPEAQS